MYLNEPSLQKCENNKPINVSHRFKSKVKKKLLGRSTTVQYILILKYFYFCTLQASTAPPNSSSRYLATARQSASLCGAAATWIPIGRSCLFLPSGTCNN